MKNYSRQMSVILIFSILCGLLVGCGTAPTSTSSNDKQTEMVPQVEATEAPSTANSEKEKQSDTAGKNSPIPSDSPAPTNLPVADPDPTVTPAPVEETPNVPAKTETPSSPVATDTPAPQSTKEPETLDDVQRNSIAMLNYLTVLTQEINASKGSRLFLEQAYSSLINNTYPNAVDIWTQGELDELLDNLESFRMVNVKRERLQYIYEHNKAQALRSAIPNPISILSNVSSRGLLKTAVSLIFMAVDSVSSYNAFNDQNDMQYLKDGWELDDQEAAELSTMRRNSFSYMIDMVRTYNLPGDLALNENAVTNFVEWKSKTNVVSRISILESNEKTYEAMGSYWLVLAKSYYENGEYSKCLGAIEKYEEISSRIFRKDYEFADTLPYAILSAQEVYSGSEYETIASRYCETILSNTDADDWASHYFVALIYMDLYASTQNSRYLDEAYGIALDNVTYLVDEQRELNATWLADVKEETAAKNATKQEKEDIKQYNKMLKEERKKALPPISEPLYLNCELLFGLAEKKGIPQSEKTKIDAILHENGENLFLVAPLDNCYRFNSTNSYPDAASMDIEFDGKEITIPAYAVSAGARIEVTASGGSQLTVGGWTLDKVTRPNKGGELSFTATYKSNETKNIKFEDGMTITIKVYPRSDKNDLMLLFVFNAKETGLGTAWNPIKTIVYERVQ